jgi:hypothetical protein
MLVHDACDQSRQLVAQAVGDLLEQQCLHLAAGVVHQLVGLLVDGDREPRLELVEEQRRAIDRRGCVRSVLDDVGEDRDDVKRTRAWRFAASSAPTISQMRA